MIGACSKTSGTTGTDTAARLGGEIAPAPLVKLITATMVKPPLFVMTPGQGNTSIFINYTSGTGVELSKSATEKSLKRFTKSSKL